jgi:hypothetical protein
MTTVSTGIYFRYQGFINSRHENSTVPDLRLRCFQATLYFTERIKQMLVFPADRTGERTKRSFPSNTSAIFTYDSHSFMPTAWIYMLILNRVAVFKMGPNALLFIVTQALCWKNDRFQCLHAVSSQNLNTGVLFSSYLRSQGTCRQNQILNP